MNSLIVLFCAIAAQAAYVPYLPYLPYHHKAAVPSVAKSTITYKTAAFEPVDAATPADTHKIELVEKEHSQDVYTPTYTYAAGVAPAVAPAAVVHHPYLAGAAGLYGGVYGDGLLGYPFAAGVAAPAAAAAAAEESAEAAPAVEEA